MASMEVALAKAYGELEATLQQQDEPRVTVDDLESLAKTNDNLKSKLDKQSHDKVVELHKKAAALVESEKERIATSADAQQRSAQAVFKLNEIGRIEDVLFQVGFCARLEQELE